MFSVITRTIALFVLAGATIASTAITVAAKPQDASIQVRVYDSDHRDYHNWDDREDHAYRRYYSERHRRYREYDKQRARDQRNYWRWRHNHPDRD